MNMLFQSSATLIQTNTELLLQTTMSSYSLKLYFYSSKRSIT